MPAAELKDPDRVPTRQRLVATAARLFRERGVTGTGLLTILEAADAPRGSLYHHFPGGKDELIIAALEFEGARVTADLDAVVATAPDAPTAMAYFAEALALSLEQTGFRLGCPVSTAALELSSESEAVRAVCARTYAGWQALMAETLIDQGYEPAAAAGRAELTLAALEGAMLLARAQRDGDVIRRVMAVLADGLSTRTA